MSKNKKRKWWDVGAALEPEVVEEKFSNTIRQHNERIGGMGVPTTREMLFNDDDGDGYDYGGYTSRSYTDWNRRYYTKPEKTEGEKISEDLMEVLGGSGGLTRASTRKRFASNDRLEFARDWESSWNSGDWRGYDYYKKPQLTYRYVQQMANALASAHKIKVSIGNNWDTNLEEKSLTYNPVSLIYNTKGELLGTLMHEIGKLRYMSHFNTLKDAGRAMKEYGLNAYRAMLPYEEVRTDKKMLTEYESAGELYEAQEPELQKVFDGYKEMSFGMREFAIKAAGQEIGVLIENIEKPKADTNNLAIALRAQELMNQGRNAQDAAYLAMEEHRSRAKSSPDEEKKAQYRMYFGPNVEDKVQAMEVSREMVRKIKDKDTLYDYIAGVYNKGYMLERESDLTPTIIDRVEKTAPSMEKTSKMEKSSEVAAEMEEGVYPVIEDLLREAKNGFDELNALGPQMKKQVWDKVKQQMEWAAGKEGEEGQPVDKNGNSKPRVSTKSGPSNETTIPEWFSGAYQPLYESVKSEIQRLVRLLTFLRRAESVTRWTSDQRRGKLDMKKLYKVGTGSRRVFRKKLETVDTVRSFAFSIVMDVSGSMAGARIANTTRALIILSEVFTHMGIPFELITFDDGAKHIKKFEDPYEKKVKDRISGLPNYRGGGTNLEYGIEESTLAKRPERSKVFILLSDGGVGNAEDFNERYFRPMEKEHGIKSLAFGLETSGRDSDELMKLCNGNGRVIDNAAKLPGEFAELLKSLILRR